MTSPLVLTITHRFNASPERVFDAWLEPDKAKRFLFKTPDGVMHRVDIDPRVGGKFQIIERRGEEHADHFGEYVEIDRPRRLVFLFGTTPGEELSRVTIEITPTDGGCELTLTHEMDPRWGDYEGRVREGWTTILDGLARVLAGGE